MHDKDLNWLKGIAILFVILFHSISSELRFFSRGMFYLGQAVPIFILISGFVLSKKIKNSSSIFKKYFSKPNISSFFFNIIFPACVLSITQFFFLKPIFFQFLKKGLLLGSGSYYILVYLQIWLLIPCLVFFYRHISSIFLQILIIILVQIIGFHVITDPAWYRLSALRYILVLYFGVLLQIYSNENSNTSFKTTLFSLFSGKLRWIILLLSCLSGILLYFIVYKGFRSILLPKYWEWVSYATNCYTLLFIYFMLKCKEYLNKVFIFSKIFDLTAYLGRCSFGMYLMQLVFFSIVSSLIPSNRFTFPIIAIIFSSVSGIVFHKVNLYAYQWLRRGS